LIYPFVNGETEQGRIHRLAPGAAVIRIAITAAAYDAICSTMPEDEPLIAGPSSGGQ
jgi:hypothetical protein